MTGTLDPGTTAQRRLLIAASCALAPATLLAAFLVGPSMAYDDAAASLTDVAAGRATSVAQAVLLLISSALFIPVVVGALNLLRRQGRAVGTLGAIAFVAGICGHLMLVGTRLVLVQMAVPGANRTAMATLAHRLGHGVFTVITPLELCFDVGLVLLFIGLRRAAAIPGWVLAVVIAVAVAAGVLGSSKAAFVIAGVGGLIAGTYVGVRVARADNAAWTLGYLTGQPTEHAQLTQLAPAT